MGDSASVLFHIESGAGVLLFVSRNRETIKSRGRGYAFGDKSQVHLVSYLLEFDRVDHIITATLANNLTGLVELSIRTRQLSFVFDRILFQQFR